MAINNHYWKDVEKRKLWIAYELKVPLKVIALFFGRSPTAINKALCRFQIRPLGVFPRGVKKGSSQFEFISLQHFSTLMSDCFLEQSHAIEPWKDNKNPKFPSGVTDVIDSKTIMGARVDSPFACQPLQDIDPHAPENKKILQQARLWISFETLIEKLNSYKVTVRMCKTPCSDKGQSPRFTFNGVLMTAAQLLIAANKIFHAHGEDTVYVDEITF